MFERPPITDTQGNYLHLATKAFEKRDYNSCYYYFNEIQNFFENSERRILTLLSPEELIMFGISCIMMPYRFISSNSFVHTYGYGGKWLGVWANKCFDSNDLHGLPRDIDTICNNIRMAVMSNPYIKEATLLSHLPSHSEKILNTLNTFIDEILIAAQKEYSLHVYLSAEMIKFPSLLTHYFDADHPMGFFKHNGELFFCDAHKMMPSASAAIYRVNIFDKKIYMNFFRFFRIDKTIYYGRRAAPVLDCDAYTIQFISKDYLVLDSCSGKYRKTINSSENEAPKELINKMSLTNHKQCPLCMGNRFLWFCSNRCKIHICKNDDLN